MISIKKILLIITLISLHSANADQALERACIGLSVALAGVGIYVLSGVLTGMSIGKCEIYNKTKKKFSIKFENIEKQNFFASLIGGSVGTLLLFAGCYILNQSDK